MAHKLHWLRGWDKKVRRWAYLCDTKKSLKARKGRTIRYTKDPGSPDLCGNCARRMGPPVAYLEMGYGL